MNTSAWFLQADGSAVADWSRLWSEACRRFGSLPAVIQRDGVLTYQDLDHLSQAFANSLKDSAGWRIGRAVTLEADPNLFVVPLLGIWKAGGVAIPVPPANSPTDDVKVLEEPIRVLTQREQVVSGDGIGHAIYFTSGSTGSPRAVLRGWRQALFEAGRYSELLGLRERMEATMLIAPWFGASTKHFLGCLLSGCLQRFGSEFPGDSDLLHATPAHLSMWVRTQVRRTRYRWISLTGEPIQPEARTAIQSLAMPDGKVLNALGGTEFGVVLNQTFPAWQPQNDLIGNPPTGKRVVLLSDNGTPVAPGEPGRLFVESEFVAEVTSTSTREPSNQPHSDPRPAPFQGCRQGTSRWPRNPASGCWAGPMPGSNTTGGGSMRPHSDALSTRFPDCAPTTSRSVGPPTDWRSGSRWTRPMRECWNKWLRT